MSENYLMNLLFLDWSPRHLQKFWGASGDFWQNLWTRLYDAFEGHDAALFFFGEKQQVGTRILSQMFLSMLRYLNNSGLNDLLLYQDTL